jgi:hypothetical protein
LDRLSVRDEGGRAAFFINEVRLDELMRRSVTSAGGKTEASWKVHGFVPVRAAGLENGFFDNVVTRPVGVDVPIFLCSCGVQGCGDVTVQIAMDERHVVWRGFALPGRAGVVPKLGPFTFTRRQYEQALGVRFYKDGLSELRANLGTSDEQALHRELVKELKVLIACIVERNWEALARLERLTPNREPGKFDRELDQLPTPLVNPPDEEFDTYQLDPWLEPDYASSQVGTLRMDLWDDHGPSNLMVEAEILYHPDGVQLRLCSIRRSGPGNEAM